MTTQSDITTYFKTTGKVLVTRKAKNMNKMKTLVLSHKEIDCSQEVIILSSDDEDVFQTPKKKKKLPVKLMTSCSKISLPESKESQDEVVQMSVKEKVNLMFALSETESSENSENIDVTPDIESYVLNGSQNSNNSYNSDSTIILTPIKQLVKKEVNKDSPLSTTSFLETEKLDSKIKILSPNDINIKSKKPVSTVKASPQHKNEPKTPSKSPKFYSPIKKKAVKTPTRLNNQKKSPSKFIARQLFTVDHFTLACEGQDDKTILFLKMIHDFLENLELHELFSPSENVMLHNIFSIDKVGVNLLRALYWRMEKWYREDELLHFLKHFEVTKDIIQSLASQGYLESGKNKMDIGDFENVLKLEDVKAVCKQLKLKFDNKATGMEAIKKYSRRNSSIGSFFGGSPTNQTSRVVKIFATKVGPCYRMSENLRETLYKLYHISYLGMDPDIIRDKKLEFVLLNIKSGRECYPISDSAVIDNASLVFSDSDAFERYMKAHKLYEDFLDVNTDISVKLGLIRKAFNLYKTLQEDCIKNYAKTLPWLRRYTTQHMYLKTCDEGIIILKQQKCYEDAVDILKLLIQQNEFKVRKKGSWIDELALVYQKYLMKNDEAAKLLVESIDSDMDDELKDSFRKRAGKLKCSDEETVTKLRDFAASRNIEEHSLPSQIFNKGAMDNITNGSLRFSTKTDDGIQISSVENYVLMEYIRSGEFNHGAHWEGRIVNTLFFLLFWDVIYNPAKRIPGLYLSRYQIFPNDMFSKHFYLNRKDEIDDRIRLIELMNCEEVTEVIENVFAERREGERSGLNDNVSLEQLKQVCACLGGKGVSTLVSRLARDYARSHSGFPDLTMWNTHTKEIMFIEVKSENDKASIKQVQWMHYMKDNNIKTQFAYVTTKRKKTMDSQKS